MGIEDTLREMGWLQIGIFVIMFFTALIFVGMKNFLILMVFAVIGSYPLMKLWEYMFVRSD